jgi:hypothetical protein
MGKFFKGRLGRKTFYSLAILYSLFCVLVLCSCRSHGVSETNLAPPTEDTVRLAVDSSLGTPELVEVKPDNPISTPVSRAIVKQEAAAPALAASKTISEIYLAQVGVTELTGHNDGRSVEMYLRSVGLSKGYAWCAAYVKWCFDSAHVRTKINGAAASCYSQNLAIYKNNKLTVEPRAGDVFTLWYNSLGRIGHTGFYHSRLNSSVFMSVEGNTGQGGAVDVGTREGDGVYKKYRSFKATYAICRFAQ